MITVDGALFSAAADAMAAVVESAQGTAGLRSGDKLRDEMRLELMSALVLAFDDQVYMRGNAAEPVPIEAPIAEPTPVTTAAAPESSSEPVTPLPSPEPAPASQQDPDKVDMAAGETGVPGAAGDQAIDRERFKARLVGQASISNAVVGSGKISAAELTEAGYHFISDRQEWVRS